MTNRRMNFVHISTITLKYALVAIWNRNLQSAFSLQNLPVSPRFSSWIPCQNDSAVNGYSAVNYHRWRSRLLETAFHKYKMLYCPRAKERQHCVGAIPVQAMIEFCNSTLLLQLVFGSSLRNVRNSSSNQPLKAPPISSCAPQHRPDRSSTPINSSMKCCQKVHRFQNLGLWRDITAASINIRLCCEQHIHKSPGCFEGCHCF